MSDEDHDAAGSSEPIRHVRRPRPHGRRARRDAEPDDRSPAAPQPYSGQPGDSPSAPADDAGTPAAATASGSGDDAMSEHRRALAEARRALHRRRGHDSDDGSHHADAPPSSDGQHELDEQDEQDEYDDPEQDADDDDEVHPLAGLEAAPGRRSPLHLLPILLVVIVVLAVGGGAVYGYQWVTGNLTVDQAEESDFQGSGTDEQVVIEVDEGDSGSDIASTLVDHGVIKSATPFIRVFGSSQEASQIQPGSYRLSKQMSSAAALNELLDPASLAGLRVTIPEGLRMSAIFERVSKATGIPVKDFEKAAKHYTDYGIPKNAANSPEGYLWPGRYDIPEDATAGDVLSMMWERMDAQLTDLGVSSKERTKVLTLASIAEKEARDPDDYGRVVRTLENRMEGAGDAHGHPMKLQLDSTVAYFSHSDIVSTTPEQRATDSPYNTYKHDGLPVGPISNPGRATLEAAVDPPQGKWLYWVTVDTDTGKTEFATTYAQHEKNVKKWQDTASKKDGKG